MYLSNYLLRNRYAGNEMHSGKGSLLTVYTVSITTVRPPRELENAINVQERLAGID